MKMRAGVLVEPGRIEVQRVEVPAVSRGAILVKIKSALTCGTDLKAFMRGHPVIPMPGLFGHEFSGVIEMTGKAVKGFREGDEIMSVHSAPCKQCIYCKKKVYNLCEQIMQTKVLGAFAEYLVLPPHIVKQNVFHKPQSLGYEEAAFLEPLSCVVHGIINTGVKKGDSSLVIGAGPIGLLHLLMLKKIGARVAMMDVNKERLNFAGNIGADLCLDTKRAREDVVDFTYGAGVDAVFECTGMPEVWEETVRYIRKGGDVVLFGGCKADTKVTYDAGMLHYNELTLRGVFHYTPENVQEAYKLLKSGRLAVKKLVSGQYPLEKLEHAFRTLSRGKGIKYAIVP